MYVFCKMDSITIFAVLYVTLTVYLYTVYSAFVRHGISIKATPLR